MKTYLQEIVYEISFANLYAKWQRFDLSSFSKDKKLFDFQKQAQKFFTCLKDMDYNTIKPLIWWE